MSGELEIQGFEFSILQEDKKGNKKRRFIQKYVAEGLKAPRLAQGAHKAISGIRGHESLGGFDTREGCFPRTWRFQVQFQYEVLFPFILSPFTYEEVYG